MLASIVDCDEPTKFRVNVIFDTHLAVSDGVMPFELSIVGVSYVCPVPVELLGRGQVLEMRRNNLLNI